MIELFGNPCSHLVMEVFFKWGLVRDNVKKLNCYDNCLVVLF